MQAITASQTAKPQATNEKPQFINRELSLLAFNQRVLRLASDETMPLLERLKFLCISCTNLDEFFEVRVAALRQRIEHGSESLGPDKLTSQQILSAINGRVNALVKEQYRLFNVQLKSALDAQGIRFLDRKSWTIRQRRWLEQFFKRELLPVLSPLGLDPRHPFPRILNKSLNFAVMLDGQDAFGREGNIALVRAPRSLPRLIRIPHSYTRGANDFVFLTALLNEFMHELFPGMQILGCYQFRVTRNSELFVDEEEITDLAHALQGELLERVFADAVRLEISTGCPESIEKFLYEHFDLTQDDVYRCSGPVNLNRLMSVYNQIDRPDLKFPAYQSRIHVQLATNNNLFEAIKKHDFLLHHPYDNASPVVELLRQAAKDPDVIAIKQTLYRTGVDSVFVQLLIEAARNSKDVTAVVELRARFDEAANIGLAARLQEAGVQVVYGVVGHKTHAKMMLIVRRERGKLRRYVHLSTGNYHLGTSKAYTDISLLTAKTTFGEDVHKVFLQLSGLGQTQSLTQLLQAPFNLNKTLLSLIRQEAINAEQQKPAKIQAKLNALTDPKIIRALYKASQAGVQIDLIVRGICCLRPGVPGLSENIRVLSVLGRFLEHARVYYFENDGNPRIFCASADWMERNLHQRVEIAFPILDQTLRKRVHRETIAAALKPNIRAWHMQADGSYRLLPDSDNNTAKQLHKKLIKKLCKT